MLYADLPVDDFRPAALKTIRQEMVDSGLCRRITNQRVGFIKQIFAWGVGEELVDESTAARLKYVENLQAGMTPAVDYAPIPPVPMETVAKTLPFCPHPVLADMIRVQMYAGMRPQDICNMRLCDIDRGGDVWEYTPWEHKTEHKMKLRNGKKPGIVRWLGPKAQEILETYIRAKESTPEAFLFSPVDAVKYIETEKRLNRKTPVQPSQVDRSVEHPMVKPGEKYATGSYRTAIHRACRRAGVAKWSPNQLRHTWATYVEKEYGPEAARIILGHKSVDTTMIYIERDNARGREIARKIG